MNQPKQRLEFDGDDGSSLPRQKGEFRRVVQLFLKNRGAVIGTAVLVALVLVAVGADVVAPFDPLGMVPEDSQRGPSATHWMGTDLLGRDILSRVIYGSRLSLLIGLASVAIGVLVGVVVGLVSGYYGGGIDRFLMRLVDAMLAFPGILLALTVVSTLGPGIRNVMLAVGIASIPSYARLTRGTVLAAKQNVYVEAAEVIGCSAPRTMFHHILPNVIAPILVVSTLQFGVAVISASGLSFLGLGAQPPTPEWGLMVALGRNYLGKAWWLSTFPGLAITVTVIAINLIGDGLRESLDPRLRTQ